MTPSGEVNCVETIFYNTDGAYPNGELIKGPTDIYMEQLPLVVPSTYGTIFKISLSGDFTVIKHLVYTDGAHPYGHLTLASDGNFYGISYNGGSTGAGAIFKLTPGRCLFS
jgi:uncharacterized repeat protein (TIGR03803 family)